MTATTDLKVALMQTPDSVTAHFSDGEAFTWRSTHALFGKVREAIKNKEPADVLKSMMDVVGTTAAAMTGFGSITVTREGVFHKGQPIHLSITDRILAHNAEGFPVEPLLRFLDKLLKNQRASAVNSLYDFLEKNEVVIAEDGDFLAYKKVRDNYKDIYSGTFDNTPGAVCEMEPWKVDEVRENTCSSGLHVCSRDYLPNFGTGSGNRVVIVKINPEHVVAVPPDYNNAKMRVFRYVVVGELNDVQKAAIFDKSRVVKPGVTQSDGVTWDDSASSFNDYNYGDDDDDNDNQEYCACGENIEDCYGDCGMDNEDNGCGDATCDGCYPPAAAVPAVPVLSDTDDGTMGFDMNVDTGGPVDPSKIVTSVVQTGPTSFAVKVRQKD